MKPLDKADLDKTSFGIIQSLDELFESFIYCMDKSESPTRNYPHGRRWTPAPEGYYFCNSGSPQIATWLKVGNLNMGGNLKVKPRFNIYEATKHRCCEGNLGSFEIIPWNHVGHALILAHDGLHIANPWLAFIELKNLPVINQDNTPTWDGKNEL